jgi:hypothetical protein
MYNQQLAEKTHIAIICLDKLFGQPCHLGTSFTVSHAIWEQALQSAMPFGNKFYGQSCHLGTSFMGISVIPLLVLSLLIIDV